MFPFTTVHETPTIAEKPYIVVAESGKFSLVVPEPRVNSSGTTWSGSDFTRGRARASGLQLSSMGETAKTVGFENVFVARNSTDDATSINAKLAAGLHLLLTPGIYQLDAALELKHAGQVVLGIGMATLVSAAGAPCIRVGGVAGVRVAGLLLQAGPVEAPTYIA